jgi:drug/metabolite transporter (DMT)-like permease
LDIIGELAAVVAALAFSITSTLFTLSGREVGAALTLRTGLLIGLMTVFGIHWLIIGQPFPLNVELSRWMWLGISGIFGYWLSFICAISAFILIGPRLSVLIGAIAPMLSTILAWVFLDEVLESMALLGITVTLAGIMWVVSERGSSGHEIAPRAFRTGVALAAFGAVIRSVSFIMTKEGLAGDFDPLTGSFIRLLAATVAIWLFTSLRGQLTYSLQTLRQHPYSVRRLSLGAICGPAIGASLMVFSLQAAPVGVTSTLVSLSPIFLIPIGFVVFHDKITRRAVVGTVIAIVGTAILLT